MYENPEHIPHLEEPTPQWRSYVLGTNVNRLRKRNKINKKTFSLMTGISRPFLDRIESGEANPRISIVETMAAALGTTPQELLTPPFEPFPLPAHLAEKQPARCAETQSKATQQPHPQQPRSASAKNKAGA